MHALYGIIPYLLIICWPPFQKITIEKLDEKELEFKSVSTGQESTGLEFKTLAWPLS